MIGSGYVGLVSGACFADLGNNVWCVDKNHERINLLNNNEVPFYEPGLEDLVKKNFTSNRLKFTTNLELAVRNSDIIFICVGTPTLKKSRSADISHVFKVAKEILTLTNSMNNYPSSGYVKVAKLVNEWPELPLPDSNALGKIINPYGTVKLSTEKFSNQKFH